MSAEKERSIKKMTLIAPSLLAANFARLAESIKEVEKAGADWLHIDVMDGHFVPNLTIGPPVVSNLRKETNLFFDVHLMIEKPDLLIPDFIKAGSDLITVHEEACPHLHRTIAMIKAANIKAGVALNPATPVNVLECIIEEIDLVLLMSVNPGFGGQSFIQGVIPKIVELKSMLGAKKSAALIQVDGGINPETGRKVVAAGCDVLVAGSFVFKANNPTHAVKQLKELF